MHDQTPCLSQIIRMTWITSSASLIGRQNPDSKTLRAAAHQVWIAGEETSPSGRPYYSVYYSIILHFGLTEFKAQLAWDENVRLNPCL